MRLMSKVFLCPWKTHISPEVKKVNHATCSSLFCFLIPKVNKLLEERPLQKHQIATVFSEDRVCTRQCVMHSISPNLAKFRK